MLWHVREGGGRGEGRGGTGREGRTGSTCLRMCVIDRTTCRGGTSRWHGFVARDLGQRRGRRGGRSDGGVGLAAHELQVLYKVL